MLSQVVVRARMLRLELLQCNVNQMSAVSQRLAQDCTERFCVLSAIGDQKMHPIVVVRRQDAVRANQLLIRLANVDDRLVIMVRTHQHAGLL